MPTPDRAAAVLTDGECAFLRGVLKQWVGEGFTIPPYPPEFYDVAEKVGYPLAGHDHGYDTRRPTDPQVEDAVVTSLERMWRRPWMQQAQAQGGVPVSVINAWHRSIGEASGTAIWPAAAIEQAAKRLAVRGVLTMGRGARAAVNLYRLALAPFVVREHVNHRAGGRREVYVVDLRNGFPLVKIWSAREPAEAEARRRNRMALSETTEEEDDDAVGHANPER